MRKDGAVWLSVHCASDRSPPIVEAVSDRTRPVLLVCSAGGHLLQLASLRDVWDDYPRSWVTLDRSDARSILEGEHVIYASGPTERNLPNLIRNSGLALRTIRKLRPQVIVTTGAALAVPFAWFGRLFGARVIFIESLCRITEPSLTLRLISPVVDRVYVQWPELEAAFPTGRYVGGLFSTP